MVVCLHAGKALANANRTNGKCNQTRSTAKCARLEPTKALAGIFPAQSARTERKEIRKIPLNSARYKQIVILIGFGSSKTFYFIIYCGVPVGGGYPSLRTGTRALARCDGPAASNIEPAICRI